MVLFGEFGEFDRLTSPSLDSGYQYASLIRASRPAGLGNADGDGTPRSRVEGRRHCAGDDGGDGEVLQPAILLGKLPFELICEVSVAHRWLLRRFCPCL